MTTPARFARVATMARSPWVRSSSDGGERSACSGSFEARPVPLRVLVVEDDPDAAAAVAGLLASLGHRVGTASTGEAARERATELLPDVILLDLGLPDVDGLVLARHLRDDAAGRALRLIALTGWTVPGDDPVQAGAGIDARVLAPASLRDLRALLGDARPERWADGSQTFPLKPR